MKRKRLISFILSALLVVSMECSPIMGMPVFAAENDESGGIDAPADEAKVSEEQSVTAANEAEVSEEQDAMDAEAAQAEQEETTEKEDENNNSTEVSEDDVQESSVAFDDGNYEDNDESESTTSETNTFAPKMEGSSVKEIDDATSGQDSQAGNGNIDSTEEAESEEQETGAQSEAAGFNGTITVHTKGQSFLPGDDNGISTDDLFAEYVEIAFGQPGSYASAQKKAKGNAGSRLSGVNRAIYSYIAGQLPAIAAGEQSSTVFEINIDELGLGQISWTAEELAVASIFVMDENGDIVVDENGSPRLSENAVNAVQNNAAFDLSLIVNSLLADFPYQLYWYEKTRETKGTGYELAAQYDVAEGVYKIEIVGSISFNFPVSPEFAAGEYSVDNTIGQSIQESVENANTIMSEYSTATDYDKLCGYKNSICDLVSYNYEAAGDSDSYGNPWQMIWVFDGDPATNVVCEGYSKAFKYLCDGTDFNADISSITVTGTIRGGTDEGPHMWNIVNMEDGNNYLVDVTNSDTGTSGENGELFLVPYTSGSLQEGYTFRCNNNDIHYEYDESTFSIYQTDDLTIADDVYKSDADVFKIIKQPQDVTANVGDSIELSLKTNKEDAAYQWQWSTDGAAWENCVYEGSNTDTLSFLMQEELSGRHYRCIVTLEDSSLTSDEAVVNIGTIASGTWGTCDWEISVDGVLTIHAGTGEDNHNGTSPWYKYAKQIKEIVAVEDIVLPSLSHALFAIYWVENYEAYSLCTKMDLSGLDTSNVTDMSWLFFGDTNLKSLDLSGFNTDNVTRMDLMFQDCRKMETLDISGFNTRNVTNMYSMFEKCWKLKELDVSEFDTSKVVDMADMFAGCRSLTSLDVSGFQTNQVTNMSRLFFECNSLTNLDVSGFNTRNVSDMSSMFANCVALQELDVSGFDTSRVIDFNSMFQDCWEVSFLDVTGFDTRCAKSMDCMFYECHSLTELDVTKFNTSNVTDIGGMFAFCSNLESLDVTGFDTTNVTCMNDTFRNCSKLTELDVTGFDTGNVTQMICMFYHCNSLQHLDVTGFDTRNVTGMSYMFGDCWNLRSIDVSGFDTRNTKYMSAMFIRCKMLKDLDLSNFIIEDDTDTEWLCRSCSELNKLTLPDTMGSVGPLAFDGCPKITIYTHSGMYVEQYCKENGIRYVIVDKREEKDPQNITVNAAASVVAVGKTVKVTGSGNKGTLSFASSNTAIATVGRTSGVVTAKKVGVVTITVLAAETDSHKAASRKVTLNVVPAATASIMAKNQVAGIRVTWKKVVGATGYFVYRNGKKIVTISKGTTVTYTDKKANQNGKKYTYKIVAKASTGNSTLSKSMSTCRVSRPVISFLKNSASRKMKVEWGRNNKASGYQVQYSLKSNFASPKTVTISKNKTVSKVIGNVTKGRKYYIRVRSFKTVSGKKYYSAWSASKTVTIKE